MHSELRATVLAVYNSRSRVTRGEDGAIHLYWGSLCIMMTQAEFLSLAGMLNEAEGRRVRCGELARCPCGSLDRCAMGQITLRHGNLVLWFSPEEFEEFGRLVSSARQRLSDLAPAPAIGVRWSPQGDWKKHFSPN